MVIKGVIDVYAGAADVCMINVDEMDKGNEQEGINVVNVNKNEASPGNSGSGFVFPVVRHECLDTDQVGNDTDMIYQEPLGAA